jgi:hypothetical protein
MGIFARQADRFFMTYRRCQGQILLGLQLTQAGESISIVKLPPVGGRHFEPLDEAQILRAVFEGIAEANRLHKAEYFPKQVLYVPNDPPDYPLYKLCASIIVSQVAGGAEFPPMTTYES